MKSFLKSRLFPRLPVPLLNVLPFDHTPKGIGQEIRSSVASQEVPHPAPLVALCSRISLRARVAAERLLGKA